MQDSGILFSVKAYRKYRPIVNAGVMLSPLIPKLEKGVRDRDSLIEAMEKEMERRDSVSFLQDARLKEALGSEQKKARRNKVLYGLGGAILVTAVRWMVK